MAQKILIVDDEPVARKNLTQLLAKKEYDVQAVSSGELAIKAVEEEDYDIALVDLKMPKMNGLEVLQAMKERRPDIYVIIITAYATVETAIEAMKLGAFDYLRRPFKVKDLKEVIKKAADEMGFEKRLIEQKTTAPEKDVFLSFLGRSKGKRAMGFTTEDPKDIQKKYKLKDVPFYWISSKRGRRTIMPSELDKIYRHTEKFVKGNPDSVVLVHGIESLIKHNSKRDFNEFLVKLNRCFLENDSLLMVSADPLDLDKDELFQLENVLTGNYTQIMSDALANPIRRDILRYLARVGGASFTQILGNIPENDSAKFSFHVKKLTSYDIISKDGKGNYTLTKRGNNLISILKNIEEERIKESPSHLLVSSS